MKDELTLWEEKNLIDQQTNLSKSAVNDNCDTTIEIKKDLTKPDVIDTKNISGIYKIVNKINGKYYVGSAKVICNRWREHKRTLKIGTHHCAYLQRSWNKNGECNFEFIVVEKCSSDIRFIVEQKYLDIAKTEKDKCYNSQFLVNGGDKTEETKKRMSEARKGVRLSEETKRKLSEMNKGKLFGTRHPLTDETKEKLRRCNIGKHHTEEARLKIVTALKEQHRLGIRQTFDKQVYTFENVIINEKFVGLRKDFIKKYTLPKGGVSTLIRTKKYKGWKMVGPAGLEPTTYEL